MVNDSREPVRKPSTLWKLGVFGGARCLQRRIAVQRLWGRCGTRPWVWSCPARNRFISPFMARSRFLGRCTKHALDSSLDAGSLATKGHPARYGLHLRKRGSAGFCQRARNAEMFVDKNTGKKSNVGNFIWNTGACAKLAHILPGYSHNET